MSADWRSGRSEIVWITSEIVWKRLKTSDPDVSDFWENSDATPVPMIQPISEGVKKMIEYCEVCKIILSGDRVGPVTSLSLMDE